MLRVLLKQLVSKDREAALKKEPGVVFLNDLFLKQQPFHYSFFSPFFIGSDVAWTLFAERPISAMTASKPVRKCNKNGQ